MSNYGYGDTLAPFFTNYFISVGQAAITSFYSYSYLLFFHSPNSLLTFGSTSAYYSPLLDIGLFKLFAILLDLRLLASSSRQTSFANRHSTWPEGVLRYVFKTRSPLHSRTRLPQRLCVLRPAHCHFSMLIRCPMSVTLVFCRITWFGIRSRRKTPSIALSKAR
jgi:hypothetical protein